MSTIKVVKLNRVRLKDEMQENATGKFREFFTNIQTKEKGLKGFIILENDEDRNETLVLNPMGIKARYG